MMLQRLLAGLISAVALVALGARANNLSKAWIWSGPVIRSGNRVTLRSSQGPSTILIRSGNTLYGVAEDPMVEATIMMSFERDG